MHVTAVYQYVYISLILYGHNEVPNMSCIHRSVCFWCPISLFQSQYPSISLCQYCLLIPCILSSSFLFWRVNPYLIFHEFKLLPPVEKLGSVSCLPCCISSLSLNCSCRIVWLDQKNMMIQPYCHFPTITLPRSFCRL